MSRLVLIDGSSYLYRAFHALPPLSNAQGEPTGALFGVVNMLRSTLKERPAYVAFVVDAPGKTFRDDLYDQYKANRPPMPDELRSQVEPMCRIVEALGISILRVPGVEADDVIGTLALQGLAQDLKVTISTGDKDFAQLVRPGIELVNTMTGSRMDSDAAVMEKFGVRADQIIDLLALMGDAVDNVPGVEKCGPKTAAKWLAEYQHLDGVMAAAPSMKGKIGENLRAALERLPLNRELVTIRTDVQLDASFPRMTWAEAMRRYGSDKPDLRIALELVDVAELVRDSEFPVFTGPANDAEGRVAALRIPGGASLSRKQIDEYAAHAAKYGAKGLAYIKIADNGEISSPIEKFFSEASFAALVAHVGAGNGDIVFFGAGGYNKVSDFMGALRLKAGKDFGLVADGWAPLWVTDFPMFEWDEEEQRYVALHHPFTAPAVDDIADLRANARTAVSRGYDMVLNGNEIGGGSIRIHRPDMQSAVFELLGIGAEEARAKFGFLLDALNYGAPPHGGIAFGIDRIAALMAGTESIRDVIPFPKTTGAQDLMTDAPSPIVDAQLAEVHIQVRPKTN